MYYEIIVCKNGRHFFATAERSIPTLYDLHEVYDILAGKFPESEGYQIIVHKCCRTSEEIDINTL